MKCKLIDLAKNNSKHVIFIANAALYFLPLVLQ